VAEKQIIPMPVSDVAVWDDDARLERFPPGFPMTGDEGTRAYVEAQHPRDPGGEGGGQWITKGTVAADENADEEYDPTAEYLVPIEYIVHAHELRDQPGQGSKNTRTTTPQKDENGFPLRGTRDALQIQADEALGPGHEVGYYNTWTTQQLRKLTDPANGAKVAVRVPSTAVPMVLDRGEIVSAFDPAHAPNDRTSSESYMRSRDEVEQKLFGGHPVYGYVGTDNEDLGGSLARAFGDTKLTLRDDVRYRTTVTYSDSMFVDAGDETSDVVPRPIDYPDHLAVASWMNLGGVEAPVAYKGMQPRPEPQLDAETLKKIAQTRDPAWAATLKREALDKAGYNPWRSGDFIEAQIHGPIKLADIERVDFPEPPDPAVTSRLDKAGISWTVGGPEPATPAPVAPDGTGKFVRITHKETGEISYAEGLASQVMKQQREQGTDTSVLSFAPIDRTPAEDIRIREGGAGKAGDDVKISKHGLTYIGRIESVGPKNAKVTYTTKNGKTKTVPVAHHDYRLV